MGERYEGIYFIKSRRRLLVGAAKARTPSRPAYIVLKRRYETSQRSGATAWSEGSASGDATQSPGQPHPATPHEDLNFELPVLRLYTFLRCFIMCDIITRRPEKPGVGFLEQASTRTRTWPPKSKHNPSEIVPGVPRSVLKSLEWIRSREGTKD